MKLDWKKIAQSTGYKSMKAAVTDEANRCAKYKRKPDDRYKKAFNFAINRAKHYTHKKVTELGIRYSPDLLTIYFIDILDTWENKRTYNFMSFYSNYNIPKLYDEKFKPWKINAYIKSYKKERFWNKQDRSIRIRSAINNFRKNNATKNPKRWEEARKKREKYFRIQSGKQSV
jgi:hypothetical protein